MRPTSSPQSTAAAGPGDRITVRAGTYAERVVIDDGARSGTADQPLLLQGDGRPRIIPAATEMSLVDVSRPHWILDGFEVDAQGQNRIGVSFSGSTEGSVLRASLVHAGSGPSAVSTSAGASGTATRASPSAGPPRTWAPSRRAASASATRGAEGVPPPARPGGTPG